MKDIAPQVTELPNGITLCLQHAPDVAQVAVELPASGENHAGSNPPETPHVVEHLVRTSSRRLPDPQDFREAIERNGSFANGYTYAERQQYTLLSPVTSARDFGHALDAFLGGIEAPYVTPGALDPRIISVVREELLGYRDDDARLLWPRLTRAAGRYCPDLQESTDRLGDITPEHVREHHARTYTTRGMRVVVTGPQDVINQNGVLTGRFANMQLPDFVPEPAANTAVIQPEHPVFLEHDKAHVYYLLGRVGMRPYGAPLRAAKDIFLGQLFEYQRATLFEEVRTAGLAYGIQGRLEGDEYGSDLFTVFGEVSVHNAPKLVRVVQRQLEDAVSGMDPAQFEQVKHNTVGRLMRQFRNIDARHALAVAHLRRYGGVHTSQQVIDQLNDTTHAEYRRNLPRLFAGGVAISGAVGAGLAQHTELAAALQDAQDFLGAA